MTGDPACLDKTGSLTKKAKELRTTMKLNVNTCIDTEFNCGDGYCIDISLRCDGDIDCPDKTGSKYLTKYKTRLTIRVTKPIGSADEVDCSLFEIDDSYIKESPPKGVTNGTLVEVGVGVDVLSILEISEVDGFIAIQIRLNLTW